MARSIIICPDEGGCALRLLLVEDSYDLVVSKLPEASRRAGDCRGTNRWGSDQGGDDRVDEVGTRLGDRPLELLRQLLAGRGAGSGHAHALSDYGKVQLGC